MATYFVQTVVDFIQTVMGCIGGCIGLGFEWLFSSLANWGKKQPLSDRAKRVMSEFFPSLDLTGVELVTSARLAIAPKYRGLTLGNTIYLRKVFEECSLDDNGQSQDMKLLMHELAHVDQYHRLGWFQFACQYGKGVLLNWDHDKIPLEREAIAFVRANEDTLKDVVAAVCADGLVA